MTDRPIPTIDPTAGAPAARLIAVTKRYEEGTALAGVDLAIPCGAVVALLGPNGAGKTTAVKLLLGLTRPDAGRAELFGGSPTATAGRLRLGTMLQVSKVPDTLKVREQIELFSSYYDDPLPLAETVATAGLEGLEERLYGELSGGQQQRLLYALACCGRPDLLVLDEPTVGLDVEARRGMWRGVRHYVAAGGSVLLTTHYLEEADALADHVVVLHRGRVIAEGTPSEIKGQASGRRIRCVSRLDLETAAGLAGVTHCRRDGTALELLSSAGEATVRELLARDPELSALEVSSAALEDAFLALTEVAANAA